MKAKAVVSEAVVLGLVLALLLVINLAAAANIDENAQIVSWPIKDKTYTPGQKVTVTVTIRNTGSGRHKFYIRYSVMGPDGKWRDARYKSVTLSEGKKGKRTLYWRIPSGAPSGEYLARVAVWKRASGGLLHGRLDMREKSSAFTVRRVSTVTVKIRNNDDDKVRVRLYVNGKRIEYHGTKTWTISGSSSRTIARLRRYYGTYDLRVAYYDPDNGEWKSVSKKTAINRKSQTVTLKIPRFKDTKEKCWTRSKYGGYIKTCRYGDFYTGEIRAADIDWLIDQAPSFLRGFFSGFHKNIAKIAMKYTGYVLPGADVTKGFVATFSVWGDGSARLRGELFGLEVYSFMRPGGSGKTGVEICPKSDLCVWVWLKHRPGQ